jgi:mRNA interferase MazF
MKNFDKWNEVKKNLNKKNKLIIPKEREIYWASIGINIGFEQDGKGDKFSRPVLVFKTFSKNMFFAIPLSTKRKKGSWFFEFNFIENEISTALIVQGKILDTKRLENRLGMINKDDFEQLTLQVKKLLNV